MYNFFFLLKISRCGLFIGALYSPEITVAEYLKCHRLINEWIQVMYEEELC